jgi:CO/xanthine dehydrogenase Mo-binding subunit
MARLRVQAHPVVPAAVNALAALTGECVRRLPIRLASPGG